MTKHSQRNMHRHLTVGRMALVTALSAGCTGTTDPAAGVRLTITALTLVNGSLEYQYDLTNARSEAIFLPACDQQVQLDFAMASRPPDSSSGSTCIAVLDGSPHRVEAGRTLGGRGTVERRAGVTYTPSIHVSVHRDLRESRLVRAAAFVSP